MQRAARPHGSVSRMLAGTAVLTLSFTGCGGAAGPATPGTSSAAATPSTAPVVTPKPRPTPTPAPTLPPGVTRVLDVDFQASGIVANGDYIWAEDHARTGAVYAIEPDTGATAGSVELRRPCDVASADGVVWVADLEAGKVVAIDPETFEITAEVTGLPGPCGLQYVAGVLWMVTDVGLGRVDPAAKTSKVIDLGGGRFPGSGVPLWAVEYGTGELSRINLKTGTPEVTIPPPGGPAEMIGLAIAFDSLWAGNEGTGNVFRLEPETGAVEREIETARPSRFLVTSTAVWLTSYSDGVVERIDPATNEIDYHVNLGGNPNGITEGFGSVWVSDTANGRFFQIDPAASGRYD